MNENINRIGNFTSSEIYKLMTTGRDGKSIGAPGLTYIEEKRIERKLGRSISMDVNNRSMLWGKFMEKRVFDLLPFGYVLCSTNTTLHTSIKEWAGTPDLIFPGKKISDIKCFEPKNFAQFADVLAEKDHELFKSEYPKEYWQLISNAIIAGVDKAEAILYMPYLSELEAIREMAEMYDGEDQWQYMFIANSPASQLPYLPDNGYYKNLITFEFTVPLADIEALHERVRMAVQILTRQ
jgi:hypothetical protein